MKRALKATPLVICAFYPLVTVNADRIPRQNLCLAHVMQFFTKNKREKESYEYTLADSDHKVCVCLMLLKMFFKKTQFSRSIIPCHLKVHVYRICCC